MIKLFEIEKELNRYGLSIEQYEQLLEDCSNKVHKISDLDWSEICDKYNLSFNPDTIRKGTQPPLIGSVFVSEFYKWKKANSNNIENEYFTKLRLEKQEIQKEKRKLYDERLDINRRLRETARLETTIEKLDKALNNISEKRYLHYETPEYYIDELNSNSMVVCLSDLHIGATYNSFDGSYNSSIAKERLNKYLREIIGIQRIYKCENCVVQLLGDLISGNIHKSVSVTNKENVIEQVKLACELISDFVYELGKHFSYIEVHGVSGNHSRIESKEDALLSERLDTLIPWFVKSMLKNTDNIMVYDSEIDDTLSTFYVKGKLFYGVHGDFDATNDNAIAKLVLWSKATPYCILCGHKHTNAMNEISGIKVIQSGCLGGSGDDYTRQKRLSGNASQTVLLVDKNGMKACFPITLE